MNQSVRNDRPDFGLLLAAGKGSRMKRNKALLPWGSNRDTTIIAAAFDVLAACPCHTIVVVLGHEAQAAQDALRDRRFEVALADSEAPMFESIRAGISAILAHQSPCRGLWLHTLDAPAVSPGTISTLAHAVAADDSKVLLPQYQGKGGHPVFIPKQFWRPILDHAGEGGLRSFWHEHADFVTRLKVNDPAVTMDLDTPADYEHALQCRAGTR